MALALLWVEALGADYTVRGSVSAFLTDELFVGWGLPMIYRYPWVAVAHLPLERCVREGLAEFA